MFSRPCLLLAIALLAACSKSKDEGTQEPAVGTNGAPPKGELPPAPKEEFRGNVRVVNLLLGKDGKPVTIDVWGRRSFKWAPVLLAKDVAYGTASDWYGVPKGTGTVAVPAGAGADAKELTALFGPTTADDESTAVVFTHKGEPIAQQLPGKPLGVNGAPDAPVTGKGLVFMIAWQLQEHEATLKPTYGGRSFFVGDGAGACVHQRVEDKGFAASILGGTQNTQFDLVPGKTTFSLHKWPAQKGTECSSPKLFETTVDVADGKGVLVLMHTRDGKTIEALQLPLWK